MSIILKIVDPAEAAAREAAAKAERELPKRATAADPPRFVCRVCGLEAEERGYCPTCLADTMRPLAPAPRR